MTTVIVFIAGLFIGKFWEQINDFIKAKLEQSKNSTGSVNRLDD